jgi:starch phosphorylase
MKAAMNGVLNCSILDGWWPEACNDGVNGWQFGNGKSVDDFKTLEELDKNDSDALYDTLLNRVIPTYYEDKDKWGKMMRESIKSTREYFSTKRMLEEYFEELYIK